jgi:membrane protease YdiL (CAAX protease family)
MSVLGGYVGMGLAAVLFQLADPATFTASQTFDKASATHPGELFRDVRVMGMLAAITLGMIVGPLYAACRAFQRPSWTFVAPTRPFRLGDTLVGFLICGGLVGLSVAISVAMGETVAPPILDLRFPLAERLTYAIALAPLLLLAAACEEVLFRGVLLQVTSGFTSSRLAVCVLNGVVFALFHGGTDPVSFAAYATMGVVLAWSVLALGGLEFATGAHFARNFVLAVMVQPLSAASAPSKSADWTELAGEAAVAAGMILFVWWAARRRRLRSI